MVCLGFEPGAAVWKAQTDPLSYGGTPIYLSIYQSLLLLCKTTLSFHVVTQTKINCLGGTFNDCFKNEIWTQWSEQINCTVAFFKSFIPPGADQFIKGSMATA